MLVGPTGSCCYASLAASSVLGYALGENLGRATFELVHPDDLAAGARPVSGLSALFTKRIAHIRLSSHRRQDRGRTRIVRRRSSPPMRPGDELFVKPERYRQPSVGRCSRSKAPTWCRRRMISILGRDLLNKARSVLHLAQNQRTNVSAPL